MKSILKVIEKLRAEEVNAKVDGSDFKEIFWIKDDVRYFIYECDIAIANDSLAWLQSSDGDDHLLVVYESGT